MSTTTSDPWATAEGFLAERADFLEVRTVPGQDGGFDVVLFIDGSYDSESLAAEVAEMCRAAILKLLNPAARAEARRLRLSSSAAPPGAIYITSQTGRRPKGGQRACSG
jgi:hypothetical protein